VCGDWPVSSLDAEQLPLDRTMKDAQPPSVHGSVKLNRVQNPHWTFADFSANRAGRSRTSMSKKQKPRGSREKQRYQRIAKATMATGIMVRKRPAVGFKAAMMKPALWNWTSKCVHERGFPATRGLTGNFSLESEPVVCTADPFARRLPQKKRMFVIFLPPRPLRRQDFGRAFAAGPNVRQELRRGSGPQVPWRALCV